MAHTTVRIADTTHALLWDLAHAEGSSMQAILAKALEAYRRQRLVEEGNAGYAALRQDPAAWQGIQEERAAWDATLADGLPSSNRRPGQRRDRGKGLPRSDR